MKVTEVVLSLSSWLSHGTEDVGGTEGEICDDGLASLELPSAEPTRFIFDFIAYASTRRIERRRRYIIHSATRDMSDGLSDYVSGPVW